MHIWVIFLNWLQNNWITLGTRCCEFLYCNSVS